MSKGLTMLVAVASGLLALVAFSLPCSAAIGPVATPSLRCERRPCSYDLSSGPFSFSFGQDSIGCEEARGSGRFTTATASRLRLTWRNCKERDTPFTFTCVDARGSSPRIRSKPLTAQFMVEEEMQVLQAGGFKVSMSCGGGMRSLIEGSLQVPIGPGACGRWRKDYRVPARFLGHGGAGPQSFYDVLVDSNTLGEYQFADPWLLSFPSKALIEC